MVSDRTAWRTISSRTWRWLRTCGRVFGKLTLWVFFIYLAAVMLFDSDRDTMHASAAAFVVAAAICGVAFSYGRVLPDRSRLRAEVVFAGENLYRAMIAFLLASVSKYGSVDLPKHLALIGFSRYHHEWLFGVMLDGLAFLFFLFGLWSFQAGIRLLHGVVTQRMKRRPRPFDYASSEEDIRRVLEEMDSADRRDGW